MGTDLARRLKELERENAQLRKVVADLTLDHAMIKETLRGKRPARPIGAKQSNRCGQ